MTTKVDQLEAWRDARDALVEALAAVTKFSGQQPYSEDPNSGYQRAEAEAQRIQDSLHQLGLAGLRQIDEAIEESDLVKELGKQASAAKEEANRLKEAAGTIGEITKAINGVLDLVGKIMDLPFL